MNIIEVRDLFEGNKVKVMSLDGNEDVCGMCSKVRTVITNGDNEPKVIMDMLINSRISFDVEVDLNLIKVVDEN